MMIVHAMRTVSTASSPRLQQPDAVCYLSSVRGSGLTRVSWWLVCDGSCHK